MNPPGDNQPAKNRLIDVLREGVGLVQMALYSRLRGQLTDNDRSSDESALLAGAVTGEVFGALNPGEKFVQFRKEHRGEIEQTLLSLGTSLPDLCPHLTDALRVQALCDHQQGEDSTALLQKAESCGWLLAERETPLPSTFMTSVRELGASLGLTLPPIPISTEEENLLTK